MLQLCTFLSLLSNMPFSCPFMNEVLVGLLIFSAWVGMGRIRPMIWKKHFKKLRSARSGPFIWPTICPWHLVQPRHLVFMEKVK